LEIEMFDDTFFGWVSFCLVIYWSVGAIAGLGFAAGVVSQVGWKPFLRKPPEVIPAT
jgi:hypothetical protein